MTWQAVALFNAIIGVAYLVIFWLIARGLWSTRAAGRNVLGMATAAIFFTCGVHHGSHAVHLLGPSLGFDHTRGLAMRGAFGWQMAVWDFFGASVALFYLSLRRSYGRLLTSPVMFEDSERIRYEERLERERSSLAEAQAITHLGSWEVDLASGRRILSAELCRIFGWAPGTAPPEGLLQAVVPEERPRVEAALAAAQAGERMDLEVRIVRHDDGEVRLVHSRGALVVDAQGEATRLVGTTQDITEARASEVARAEAEERFRVTVAHAPIGVALVALEPATRGRILTANDALGRLLGQPVEALIESCAESFLHPDDAARLGRDIELLGMDTVAVTSSEIRCIDARGHVIWTTMAGATVPAAEGTPRYGVFHVIDMTARKRFEGQLQHLADHDVLTGLFNRRRFDEELTRALAYSARYASRIAILVLDLDGFKYVNDTMGHPAGDELVTRIGGLLRGALRETDVLARLGGDEFAVILPEATEAEAVAVGEKLNGLFRDRPIPLGPARHARVTASIGITSFGPGSDLTAEELMIEADLAMYQAKESGKDRASVYRRADLGRQKLASSLSWLERLRTAEAESRYELMAQPIRGVCADTDVPFYELLLRLRGDDGELVGPATFLYMAERFDLIQQVDRWVFGQATRLLHAHHAAGNEMRLSVNISGKTMNDPRILDDFAGLLAEHPVPSGSLIVEVTETAAIVNIETAREVARGLRGLGCLFALDDFGAGFASFYYLKHLEFDFLKIDGEFVKNLHASATDQLVVQAIVQIAAGLGAQTIAEFVGDDASVDRLRAFGVDYGQGYFLGRPTLLADVLPALGVA